VAGPVALFRPKRTFARFLHALEVADQEPAQEPPQRTKLAARVAPYDDFGLAVELAELELENGEVVQQRVRLRNKLGEPIEAFFLLWKVYDASGQAVKLSLHSESLLPGGVVKPLSSSTDFQTYTRIGTMRPVRVEVEVAYYETQSGRKVVIGDSGAAFGSRREQRKAEVESWIRTLLLSIRPNTTPEEMKLQIQAAIRNAQSPGGSRLLSEAVQLVAAALDRDGVEKVLPQLRALAGR
jgi:hypothetical protein